MVFDQFEELYSKPELFEVFEDARRLFLSATHLSLNFVLGFAWKTDSTVQQDHPAYYMWHQLSDHRMQVELRRFTKTETSNAIAVFERELQEKLNPNLRRQLIESSQGYPWLLKKLSIHLFEQIRSGISQFEIVDRALDVTSLFEERHPTTFKFGTYMFEGKLLRMHLRIGTTLSEYSTRVFCVIYRRSG